MITELRPVRLQQLYVCPLPATRVLCSALSEREQQFTNAELARAPL